MNTFNAHLVFLNYVLTRKITAILIAVLGIIFGAFILAELGVQGISLPEDRYLVAVWLTFGAVSVAGSCIALWNQRVAGLIYLTATPVFLVLGIRIYRQVLTNREATWILVTLFAFGLFWHFTSRAGWPRLMAHQVSSGRKVAFGAFALFCLAGLVLLETVVITTVSINLVLDCSWPHPFASQKYEGQAVFVARMRDPGIAIVKESFWGMPVGGSKFLLIANWGIGHNELNGRTYFIDGRRAIGLLTRYLPIIDISHCSRTNPVDRAGLDLLILRKGPPQKGVRIVGQINNKFNMPQPGAKVVITGPMGSVDATTDGEGIFDLTEMPAGPYSVRAEGCDESKNTRFYRCSETHAANLNNGEIWGLELRMAQ
jgi:hypothetical protein